MTQNIPAFALALKKADDVRQRKLQAEQSKKLQSAARKGRRGFVRGSSGVSLVSVGGASTNEMADGDSRPGIGGFYATLRRIRAAVANAVPFILRTALSAKHGVSHQCQVHESSSLLRAAVAAPVLAVAVIAPGFERTPESHEDASSNGLVSRLKVASFAWLQSPSAVLFGTTVAASAVLWLTEVAGSSQPQSAGDRASYPYSLSRDGPEKRAEKGARVSAHFGSVLITRRVDVASGARQATSPSPMPAPTSDRGRAVGSIITGKPSKSAQEDDAVSRGRLSAYSSVASTDSVKDDSPSASSSQHVSGGNWSTSGGAGGGSSVAVQKKTGLAEIHRALASADSQKSINQDMQSWADELAALPHNMHRAGINMRLLGLVRNTVSTQCVCFCGEKSYLMRSYRWC